MQHLMNMTRGTTPRKIDRPARPAVPAMPTFDDRRIAAQLSDLLLGGVRGPGRLCLSRDDGHAIDLPPSLVHVLEAVAEMVSGGASVTVLPSHAELTTQEAADTLNVSRQYLVRLIDRGDLPSHKVGAHRRVRAEDVAAYRHRRDQVRREALEVLVADAEDAGGYDAPMGFGPRRS